MHLRVWWEEPKTWFDKNPKSGNGIVVGSGTDSGNSVFITRDDDGEFFTIDVDDVVKSKWVNYPEPDGEQ